LLGRIDYAKSLEVAVEKTTIPAQKGVCLQCCMGADEEISNHPVSILLAAYRQAVPPPGFPGQFGRFRLHGLKAHSQSGERASEGGFIREVGTHLTPDDIAGHKSPCVVGSAKSFS
jgi:hypothetical protein